MKEDPVIMSKNQKSKAPSPVFVIADNMDENLLKFMNKNKKENSSPKNIFLEESHGSQMSSENYGNYDDGEAEEYVGGQNKKNNLSLRGSTGLIRSQSRIDDNYDNNDDFETVNKKKEVEKTNKNQFQKISERGLNDDSIEEEDDDNYDDDNYNDNDRYSIDDKEDENENEDESNDFEPTEKFKISSFAGILINFYKMENNLL